MLYYEYAEGTGDFAKEKAAFRYKVFLYGLDDENNVTAQFQKMATYWTSAEYSRAFEAAAIIRAALKYDPFHTGLRNALLDIYYDIAVADLSKATEKIVEAQKSTLGFPGYLAPTGEFQISKEIDLIKAALPLYDNAIKPYFDLLKNSMGIDMARVDAKAALENKCFGYYLFEKEVPGRSLYAPSYKNSSGELVSVVNKDNEELFTGYKDLVLLFNMERDAAQTAAKLAKLYALRSDAGDADKARAVIGQAQQKSYTEGNKLNEIFPGEINPNDSGLTEAKAGWAAALSSLSSVKAFLDGNTNPLGLDKNFLALVQTDVPGTTYNVHKDSFNYFAEMLIPGGATPGDSLKVAKDKYDLAYSHYEKVQFNEDSIKSELQTQRRQFGDRLRAIAGAEYPGPPNPSSEYHTPENNVGGEIYLQLQNIELAGKRIEHNQQEISNLEAQIRNEIERRGKEHNINDLIQDTYIRYGDKQAQLTIEIGYINAAQAGANELAKAGDNWLTSLGASIATHGINAGIQAAAELGKALLNAEKEKLNAKLSAKITYLNDQISDANSEALVKNLLLGMQTLAIESQEAAIMLAQEVAKLQAILDEKAYLETEWEKAEQELGTRYFADPSHRIIMDQYIIDADFAFQEAQFWIFTMARALDYKRNTRFVTTYGNKSYTSSSVFKLRNAKELLDMASALWNYDQKANIGDRQGTQFVRFSLREDFLGYRRFDENNNPAYYPDPNPAAAGKKVDALAAFRSYLKNIAIHETPKSGVMSDFGEVIHLEFSAVKPNLDGTFFSSARWNEKIKWISVKINADTFLSQLMVYLEQSGTSFIRNSTRGEETTSPDRIKGEMTGYPVRYWYKNGENWLSKDVFGFGINAVVTNDPYAPAESWQKREFHEMPPAVSKWVLEVPLKSAGGQKLLDIDSVSDIEIWFYNYYHARN